MHHHPAGRVGGATHSRALTLGEEDTFTALQVLLGREGLMMSKCFLGQCRRTRVRKVLHAGMRAHREGLLLSIERPCCCSTVPPIGRLLPVPSLRSLASDSTGSSVKNQKRNQSSAEMLLQTYLENLSVKLPYCQNQAIPSSLHSKMPGERAGIITRHFCLALVKQEA